jgi:hypothetical protein
MEKPLKDLRLFASVLPVSGMIVIVIPVRLAMEQAARL